MIKCIREHRVCCRVVSCGADLDARAANDSNAMCVCVLLLLAVALPALAGGGLPAFATRQHTALLGSAGDAVALRCRVLRLAGRAVSWVRSSDLQILTHAGAVFTADARVSCSAAADPDGGSAHTLRIERLRPADAGRYECQVNTEPKMSLFFDLTVVEGAVPEVTVRALGAAEARGAEGGAARMACEARYDAALPAELLSALPPLRLRWQHEGVALDAQGARGGVSLDTERWAGRAVSRLTLSALRAADAGLYTCSVRERSAALRLRVSSAGAAGELQAMQRDAPAGGAGRALAAGRVPLVLLLLLLA